MREEFATVRNFVKIVRQNFASIVFMGIFVYWDFLFLKFDYFKKFHHLFSHFGTFFGILLIQNCAATIPATEIPAENSMSKLARLEKVSRKFTVFFLIWKFIQFFTLIFGALDVFPQNSSNFLLLIAYFWIYDRPISVIQREFEISGHHSTNFVRRIFSNESLTRKNWCRICAAKSSTRR